MSNVSQNREEKATEESFWSMLSKTGNEFSIYIPRIQRDYAQGRLDDTTSQIREKFVDDIFESIVYYQETKKVLDVNFIYGNIEDEDGKRRFIPIDGQQRLTTLFLLHWYFAVYSGKINEDDVKKRLLQFQYETRNVTGKFCRNLTKFVHLDLKEKLDDDEEVSTAIKNYYWYFSDFDNDPSVRGMLVMIDAIHNKAKKYKEAGVSLDDVFETLTGDTAPIQFLYLNIDDVGLTDTIYINMNARGKALTHFENFKAQLQDYLAKDNNDFANEFIDNINGKWSEFFWNPNYRKKVKDPVSGEEDMEPTFDSQMMKFFRFGMLMEFIINVDDSILVNNRKEIREVLAKLIGEQDYVFTSRLFKNGFQQVSGLNSDKAVLSIESFQRINKLLNVLAKRQQQTDEICFADGDEYGKTYINEKGAFQKLIGISDKALTNEEQIVLYAEYAFLIKYANDDDSFSKEKELNRWLRLVSNLVAPTLNVQLDVLFGMIRSVNKLVEDGSAIECDKFMSKLLRRNYRQSVMSVFTETQVVEESIKSILMQIDPVWKKAVTDSENTFMAGQTGALFAFSGLTAEYEKQISEYQEQNPDSEYVSSDAIILDGVDAGSTYYENFIGYLKKFNMLFDENGVRKEIEDSALFRRALLCYGGEDSYMLPPGKAIQSFLDNTSRDFSFKRLLRDDNSGKRNYLKDLMDDIVIDQPIAEQLQRIVERKTFVDNERWKEFFVKMPEILDCVDTNDDSKLDPQGNWVFIEPRRFIRRNSADDILLLTRTQTNSINRELYSYVLFLKARQMGLSVNYQEEFTDSAEKYAYYENEQGEQVNVIYKNQGDMGTYIAKKRDDTELIRHNSLESMLAYVDRTVKKL